MASLLKLKKSSVSGKVPTAADLEYGELAINYADGVLYYKDSTNNINSIGVQGIVGSQGIAGAQGIQGAGAGLAVTEYINYTYTADGNTTTYTTTSGVNVNNVLVTLNGILQRPTVDYTISGSSVVLDVAPPSGVAVQIRVLGGLIGPQGVAGSGSQGTAGTLMQTSLIDSSNTITNTITGVTALRFDSDSGFDLTDLGNGAVKVGMNSTFKTWQVDGQTDLVATGLDTIEFIAGTGIQITTNASANPKSITFTNTISEVQGIQGVQGVSGYIGADGSQGIQGIQGTSGAGAGLAVTEYTTYTYTGNGTNTTYATVDGINVHTILVLENGVTQTPTIDYTVSGSNVIFTTAPAAGVNIQIRILGGLIGAQGVTGSQGFAGSDGIQGSIGPQGIAGNQGDNGVQGLTGSQGITGSQGTIGSQGQTGFQGVTGNQGTDGLQGATGSQGVEGAQGVTGSQGIEGAQGVTGSQGIEGAQGVTGSQGAIGSQGLIGSQGTDGVQGSTGTQGTTGSQGVDGVQGITGTQGVDGIQGSDGAQGITGTQGIIGSQGVDGIQGSEGTQGTIGFQGLQGIIGSQGLIGTQGIQGIGAGLAVTEYTNYTYTADGTTITYAATAGISVDNILVTLNGILQRPIVDYTVSGSNIILDTTPNAGVIVQIRVLGGLIGLQGTAGSQGSSGIQGIQGTTGSQGIEGSQGTIGTQGIQGTTGSQGIEGSQGTTGSQGIQGTTGSQGIQGTGIQGTIGIQGIQGITGSQGVQGSGTQGTDGIQGIQGPAGPSGGGGAGTSNYGGVGYLTYNYVGNGSTTTFATNSEISEVNVDNILVTENGILQVPTTDYTVTNTNVIFTTAPVTGTNIQIRILGLRGLQGTTGLQGRQGIQGVQGLHGQFAGQGVQGNQGTQGLSSELERHYHIPGIIGISTGTNRWWIQSNSLITQLRAQVTTAPTGTSIIININKNGSQAAQLILAATTSSIESVVNIAATKDDYFTVDVIQKGSIIAGSDLVISFLYRRI